MSSIKDILFWQYIIEKAQFSLFIIAWNGEIFHEPVWIIWYDVFERQKKTQHLILLLKRLFYHILGKAFRYIILQLRIPNFKFIWLQESLCILSHRLSVFKKIYIKKFLIYEILCVLQILNILFFFNWEVGHSWICGNLIRDLLSK